MDTLVIDKEKAAGKRRKHILFAIGAVILLLSLFVSLELYISKYWLKVSEYTISSEYISKPVQIIQITDLHNSEFGYRNEKLIAKVKEENPDLILITGDLLNQDESRTDIAETLIEGLSEIAPVYCSYGNHEKAYEAAHGTDIRKIFENAGAKVLDYEWTDIEANGNAIRLGGIYGYCLPEIYLEGLEIRKIEMEFLYRMADTDRYCVLMTHMPVCWLINESLDNYDFDCVISGHAHGGQIILPFVGGFYAPDQGYFIGREWGVYDSEDGKKHLVLSTGLGSREKIPRFNNIPEILKLTIKACD